MSLNIPYKENDSFLSKNDQQDSYLSRVYTLAEDEEEVCQEDEGKGKLHELL